MDHEKSKIDTVRQYREERNSLTFQIEELDPPVELLDEKEIKELFANLQQEKVEVHSPLPQQLVSFGYHSFIYGMYQAYSDHRPFVMSPDMIWTLILQGFSHHVNFNKDTVNDVFGNLSKREITINIEAESSSLHDVPWDTAMHLCTTEIANYIGNDLIDAMRSDFSTTGITERIVSELTIMDTMKAYFEYVFLIAICGIPEITLEGKIEDWKKIKDKMQLLRKYNLSWWIDLLDPVIDQFILAYQSSIDKTFWMNMFKVHTKKVYGSPKMIDGWIFKFFPYDVDGNKMPSSGNWEIDIKNVDRVLPKEIFPVDVMLKFVHDSQVSVEHKVQCWAGFIGVTQNHKSFALRPELAWFVTPKYDKIANTINEGEYESDSNTPRRYKQLDAFPEELEKGMWGDIDLHFKHEIQLPNKIINATALSFYGQYSEQHLEELKRLFKYKNIPLVVNDEWLLQGKEMLEFSIGLRYYKYPNLVSMIKRWLGMNKWVKIDWLPEID